MASEPITFYFSYSSIMNGEETTTTIGQVAESQANISNPTEAPTATGEQPAQPEQTEQTAVADNNWTWTSSWDVEQTTQTSETTEAPKTDDVLDQVNKILEEGKTLNDVVEEEEKSQLQKENEEALDAIVKETTKDLPSDSNTDVKTEAVSSTEDSDRLDEELKQGLDDIKDKKSAEDMAKKVYLAFQKERSMHQFDNEQNANTIEVLKWMVKKLNEQVTSSDNDPRYQKLDDEGYALWRLEQSYKKDKSDTSKNNLMRYYVAKLATLVPNVSANKIMDMFNNVPLTKNTMWEGVPTSAPVAEVKQPTQTPRWIPASKRWMY